MREFLFVFVTYNAQWFISEMFEIKSALWHTETFNMYTYIILCLYVYFFFHCWNIRPAL